MINLDEWWTRAKVLKIIDGDTIEVEDDLGKGVRLITRIRLKDVNTAELTSRHQLLRDLAIKAQSYLEELLPIGTKILYRSYKKSFDRYVAEVYIINTETNLIDSVSVSQHIKDAGHHIEPSILF